MWNTDSLWFEVALVSLMTAVGTIFFGHFEEQTPKWRKVAKLVFFILLTTTISATAGRVWALGFLGLMILFVVFIHAIWLPSKGINGWTGEPKERYYELRGWKKKGK
jgi:hypothetical protein